MKVNIKIEGLTFEKLDKATQKTFPDIIRASTVAAINKVVPTIRSRATKGIASAARIKPVGLIRKRSGLWKANKKRLNGGVIINDGPMPAETLAGKAGPKWHKGLPGVKIKTHNFPGAFTGTPRIGRKAGTKRVYTRVAQTGDNRSDLRAQYIQIKKHSEKILPLVGERVVNKKLENIFVQQFNWRMEKAGF